MVTVELAGGLGNQMFQYACGRALAIKRNTTLQLNTTNPDRDPLRRYALGCFPNITAPLVQRESGFILEERSTRYQPEILDQHPQDDVFLRGYWQSEKYFASDAVRIRKDFEIPEWGVWQRVIGSASKKQREAFAKSVSIHVRRGDYITDPRSVEIMGNLPLAYYGQAMQFMASKVSNPYFVVFTDDPAWCEKEFCPQFGGEVNKGQKDHQDMFQMSLCNYHIVANSSFSWWGAWLAGTAGITIAPKKWFASRDSFDVCPESWIRI